MLVSLDNCCFNRPFDNQSQVRIQLETEAKLHIQERVVAGEIQLAWSHMLDFENSANPFEERRNTIALWKAHASVDVGETPELLAEARRLAGLGFRSKDALHVACALSASCDFFLTTDDRLLKKLASETRIVAIDPTAFVRRTEP